MHHKSSITVAEDQSFSGDDRVQYKPSQNICMGGGGTSGGADGGDVSGSRSGCISGSLWGQTPGVGSFAGIISGLCPGTGTSPGLSGLSSFFGLSFLSVIISFLFYLPCPYRVVCSIYECFSNASFNEVGYPCSSIRCQGQHICMDLIDE